MIELLIASAVLLIGLTGLTSLVSYSSKSRGLASKKAFASRFASDQLSQLAARGYDGLVPSIGASTAHPTDWLGRNYTTTWKIDGDCNHAVIRNDQGGTDATTFVATPMSASQTCCPLTGNMCCLYVEYDVNYQSDGADAGTVTASTFVTKSCP